VATVSRDSGHRYRWYCYDWVGMRIKKISEINDALALGNKQKLSYYAMVKKLDENTS